jgi:acyl dehydratase
VRNPIASAFVRNVRLDRRRFPSPVFGNDTITTQRFDDLS